MTMGAPLVLIIVLVFAAAVIAPLIPLRRRRQTGFSGFPVVTTSIIAVNIFLFAANATTLSDASGNLHTVLKPDIAQHWGMIPRSLSVLTLFTHMFLHGSWDHVLCNMLGLWLFGPHVEEALGKLEYLGFYIASGVAAALFHLVIANAFMPTAAVVPLVGASGAIFGVLGIFAVRFWRARVRVLLFLKIPAVWAMSAFALAQLIAGMISVSNGGRTDNSAYWAHVGGFLFGALIALPLKMREDSKHEYAIEDAETAVATGNLHKAAAHYRSVLAATPHDPDANFALGSVCIRLRQTEFAYRHLQEAIRLYLRAGNGVGVAKVYADAVSGFEAFPLPPALLQRVASSCEEVEQFPLAQHALAELCREHRDSKEAELSLLRLGKLHMEKLMQPENAVGIFSEFLRLYPDSEWAGHAHRLRNEASSRCQYTPVTIVENPPRY